MAVTRGRAFFLVFSIARRQAINVPFFIAWEKSRETGAAEPLVTCPSLRFQTRRFDAIDATRKTSGQHAMVINNKAAAPYFSYNRICRPKPDNNTGLAKGNARNDGLEREKPSVSIDLMGPPEGSFIV
jgi:hypothetical protein